MLGYLNVLFHNIIHRLYDINVGILGGSGCALAGCGVLRRAKAGLVRGSWERLPSGKERRYYHPTERGLEFLEAKIAEWLGFSSAVNLVMQPTAN